MQALKNSSRLTLFCMIAALLLSPVVCGAETQRRPNFLVIVADDLGFSDLGAFGGEIATPNLDSLAYAGIRFTNFHTATWCVPARAMLMSGTDPNFALTGPGYPHLRAEVLTVAEALGDAGYRTMMSGKWHLGTAPEQDPHSRGFQRSFALLEAEHNHFGGVVHLMPTTYTENGKRFTALPKDFYSSDYFASRIIGFLGEPQPRGEERKPFFAYLAFTAPHSPLQAPRKDIDKYRGRYDAGFDALKEARLARQKELGLLDESVVPHQPLRTTGHPPGQTTGRWVTWNAEQRQLAARDMEIYAAMLDRLDRNVGRVLSALRLSGELDNTVILILGDNGPQGAMIYSAAVLKKLTLPLDVLSGADRDNRLENRGSITSHVMYPPGWAEAASSPAWLYKFYATEGGTRTPAFLLLPGSQRRGEIARAYLSVADVLPTFLEMAGVPQTARQNTNRTVQRVTGRSWVPWLRGARPFVYGPEDAIGMGDGMGSRSMRRGDWKIVDLIGHDQWMLFNVVKDPGETTDLSEQYPERKNQLLQAWDAYAKSVGYVAPASGLPYDEP